LPNSSRHDFRAAAVEIDTTELRMGRRGNADIFRDGLLYFAASAPDLAT
jgi:hypothetical protein